MLEFGVAGYDAARRLPPALLPVAIQMERRRHARHRLEALEDMATADGMEQGKEYVPDPNEPPNKSKAHYSPDRYNERREELLREIYPEEYTPEKIRQRRIAESEAKWDALDDMLNGGLRA